jgi:hypothetical protein
MVRLIEKNAGLAPGSLFIAPVCELWGHHRIDVGSDFGIPEHIRRISRSLQEVLQRFVTHSNFSR